MGDLKKGTAHGVPHQMLQVGRCSLGGIVVAGGCNPLFNFTGGNPQPLESMDEGGWVLGQLAQGLPQNRVEGRPHVKKDNGSWGFTRIAGGLVCLQQMMSEVGAKTFPTAKLQGIDLGLPNGFQLGSDGSVIELELTCIIGDKDRSVGLRVICWALSLMERGKAAPSPIERLGRLAGGLSC